MSSSGYRISKAAFEQEVIVKSKVLPELYGLSSDSPGLRLTVLSEAFDPPPMEPRAHVWRAPDWVDTELCLGEMSIGLGRAFGVEAGPVGFEAPVAKSFEVLRGEDGARRPCLIEQVEFRLLLPLFESLPAPEQAAVGGGDKAARYARASKQWRLPPPRPETKVGQVDFRSRLREARLLPPQEGRGNDAIERVPPGAALGPERSALARGPVPARGTGLPGRGILLDYIILQSSSNFVFEPGTTYYVSDTVNLSGQTVLSGNVVVKSSATPTTPQAAS